MKQIKIYLIVIITLCSWIKGEAQDIHFSQFRFQPLLINPAMAGANHEVEGIVSFKDQWKSVGAPYRTFSASYDMRLSKESRSSKGFWAAGCYLYKDKAGDSKLSNAYAKLMTTYHLDLGEGSMLGGGGYFGFGQRSITYDGLKWVDQHDFKGYNPTISTSDPVMGGNSFLYPDAGVGLVYSYKSTERYLTANDQLIINGGISVQNLTRPKYNFMGSTLQQYMKWVAFGRAAIGVGNSDLSVVPGFVYMRQGPYQELYFGADFQYSMSEASKYTGFIKGSFITVGIHYRTLDAIVASLALEWSHYAIGVSYDVNTSSLNPATNYRGGFELHLRYVAPNPWKLQIIPTTPSFSSL